MSIASGSVPARDRRHWANGSAPTFFELLSDSYYPTLSATSVFRIRAVVVDADVLLKEIAAEVKRPGQVVLYAATRLGLLRVYVAKSVPYEVDRNLERVCSETGRDYATARAIWAGWRPFIRVITPPTVIPAEVRHAPLSDLPTAALAHMLGSDLTWSNDTGLQKRGFAKRYPLASALAVRDVGTAETNVHLTLRISSGSLEGLFDLARRGWIAGGPAGQLAIVAALGVLLGYGLARRQEIKIKFADSLPKALAVVSRAIEEATEWYKAVSKDLPPTPVIEMTLSREYQLARILAYAPLPLTPAEIVTRLEWHKVKLTNDEVRLTLESSPVFVCVGRWYWQLGR